MRLRTPWLALVAIVALAGCVNPFQPRIGTGRAFSEPAPLPTSPQGLMELFRWCHNQRAIAEYEELFTEDFRFGFSAVDSATQAPILRDEEIAIARRMWVDGSANEPRANSVSLEYLSRILPLPDSRPGKTSTWHKEITTGILLKVELEDERFEVRGDATFFLVRGDSALIPEQLRQRGFGPDPSRWYIERYEDHTNEGGTAAAAVAAHLRGDEALAARLARAAATGARIPARPAAALRSGMTWGQLKALFRD
jgi:hypothetical protein